MVLECLPMGCLSSRSTTVSPQVESGTTRSGGVGGGAGRSTANGISKQTVNGQVPAVRQSGGGGGRLVRPKDNYSDSGPPLDDPTKQLVDVGTSFDRESSPGSTQAPVSSANLQGEKSLATMEGMTSQEGGNNTGQRNPAGGGGGDQREREGTSFDADQEGRASKEGKEEGNDTPASPGHEPVSDNNNNSNNNNSNNKSMDSAEGQEKSFDGEELNVELLRQYIAVDFEISQLEDRDALRLYHEKIEQLEQLERELDMISLEAEEVANRSDIDLSQLDRIHSLETLMNGHGTPRGRHRGGGGGGATNSNRTDMENNSIMSGEPESLSPHSSIMQRQQQQQQQNQAQHQQQHGSQKRSGQPVLATGRHHHSKHQHQSQQQQQQQQQSPSSHTNKADSVQRFTTTNTTNTNTTTSLSKDNNVSNLSYATIEVFNRKIILEKERDKLKKEVEMIIVECDKLQQKYKRRDEILDKLFDGRTGNGLENHLEQQLEWLTEQKHYVDQVFYAWKRAETLTSQTCEQFASALELLKRLPRAAAAAADGGQVDGERQEVAKSICQLLMKSRQDMEQAQRYNPNVDAPFFTDAETERFDKIIEIVQAPGAISQSEYNQMATVIQFAYKRAVSIRLWLEQILQITIARDSFELAEEYKWIAIQLRKERISLINSKLQSAPYRALAASIREQLLASQQQQHQQHRLQLAAALHDQRQAAAQQQQQPRGAPQSDGASNSEGKPRKNEINRDSGVESDDIDIEEDIYRLLEMNKSRLEAAVAASKQAGVPSATALDATGRPIKSTTTTANTTSGSLKHQLSMGAGGASAASTSSQRDQMMRERIQKRVRGEQPLASSRPVPPPPQPTSLNDLERQPAVTPPMPNSTTDERPPQNELSGGGLNPQQVAGARQTDSAASSTPSKLRIQLDEASRQNMLKQVDQIHSKHRSRLDNLRGNNKAKASDFLANRMQQKPRS